MDDQNRRDQGMGQRRKVLGNAWVDKSIANRNAFNTDFQDLITRYAWGEIWTRPGLSRHTRSLITLGMMVALNRSEQLNGHLGRALDNGVTKDEIVELITHLAFYSGWPTAMSAALLAKDVFEKRP